MGVVRTFCFSSIFFLFFFPLLETARYELKYCLKGPVNPKQPTHDLQLNETLLLYICVFDFIDRCSAVFIGDHCINSDVSQPFLFHNLTFMVPVKEIVLFSFVFGVHLFFSIIFPL